METLGRSEVITTTSKAIAVNTASFQDVSNSVMDVMIWDRVAKGVYSVDAISEQLKIKRDVLIKNLNTKLFEMCKDKIFMC